MTIAYSVNGGTEIHGITSSWERARRRVEIDNQATFTNIAFNTWRIPRMSMAGFEILKAVEGDTLTSLETNNPEARNSAAQFTTVIIGLVDGRQAGINMEDVTIRFEVDLDSEV